MFTEGYTKCDWSYFFLNDAPIPLTKNYTYALRGKNLYENFIGSKSTLFLGQQIK